MQGDTPDEVEGWAFIKRGDKYRPVSLGIPMDDGGFEAIPSRWPGPICLDQPSGGIFLRYDGFKIKVWGDYMRMAWNYYFWDPESKEFEYHDTHAE